MSFQGSLLLYLGCNVFQALLLPFISHPVSTDQIKFVHQIATSVSSLKHYKLLLLYKWYIKLFFREDYMRMMVLLAI